MLSYGHFSPAKRPLYIGEVVDDAAFFSSEIIVMTEQKKLFMVLSSSLCRCLSAYALVCLPACHLADFVSSDRLPTCPTNTTNSTSFMTGLFTQDSEMPRIGIQRVLFPHSNFIISFVTLSWPNQPSSIAPASPFSIFMFTRITYVD